MKPLAVTMGDPAGIGGEITLKAWRALRASGPCFAVLADPASIVIPAQAGTRAGSAESVGLGARFRGHDGGGSVSTRCIADISEAPSVFPHALPILPVGLAAPVVPGRPDSADAHAVIASIEQATRLTLLGEAAAVVTNPISKAVLYGAGFRYPGHTEFLAALTGVPGHEVMMLASPMLRVVPVTVHVSLRDALAALTTEAIVAAAHTAHEALRTDFGIAAPRLAVAGLNPHAGEGGAMGSEEAAIIVPAIERLRADGIDVSGPWPPDTMFTEAARARYDAAICMYHDQALIPLKTLDMRSGVNVTLGLPIIRTSPDHGTAFDIAGKGIAEPDSLIAALRLAAELAATRARPPAR